MSVQLLFSVLGRCLNQQSLCELEDPRLHPQHLLDKLGELTVTIIVVFKKSLRLIERPESLNEMESN